MRDPARIPLILAQIETLWRKHPDQRLGQIVANFVLDKENKASKEDDAVYLTLLKENGFISKDVYDDEIVR